MFNKHISIVHCNFLAAVCYIRFLLFLVLFGGLKFQQPILIKADIRFALWCAKIREDFDQTRHVNPTQF